MEPLRLEVEHASSAAALFELTQHALAAAAPADREGVRQVVARHGRHWDRRLAEHLAVLPTHTEAFANPTLRMGGWLEEAMSCVSHIGGISGFTTGMANQYWKKQMKALIDMYRLSAVLLPGRAIFAVSLARPRPAIDRRGRVLADSSNTRARVALSWLLEFEDVPVAWLRALRVTYADDAWMVARIDQRL